MIIISSPSREIIVKWFELLKCLINYYHEAIQRVLAITNYIKESVFFL